MKSFFVVVLAVALFGSLFFLIYSKSKREEERRDRAQIWLNRNKVGGDVTNCYSVDTRDSGVRLFFCEAVLMDGSFLLLICNDDSNFCYQAATDSTQTGVHTR